MVHYINITALDLSPTTKESLIKAGISTTGQLVQFSELETAFLSINF